MTDSIRVFDPGFRVTNSSGDVVSGAKIKFFNAGTENTRTVYSDSSLSTSLGSTVTCLSNGAPATSGENETLIYTGTTAYKVIITTSADVTIHEFDNIKGAIDTSGFSNDEAIPIRSVQNKADDYTVLEADQGDLINGNSTGGDITFTLPSAVTVGNNWQVTLKHVGTANTVTVSATGGQTIDGASDFDLESQYEAITVVSDGANYHIAESGRLLEDNPPLPRSYLSGLITTNGTDASHDIDITLGEARDSSDTVNLSLTATHTKRIDASWATGSGNGGLASAVSLSTNTTYHLHLVDDGSGGTEAGFDTSLTAANLLSDTGGTYYRRIRSVRTDSSSNIRPFTPTGDEVWYDTVPALDEDTTIGTGSATTLTLASVPPDTIAIINVHIVKGGATPAVLLSPTSATDVAPALAAVPLHTLRANASGQEAQLGGFRIPVDGSSQIQGRSTETSTAIDIAVIGYVDRLGRDD